MNEQDYSAKMTQEWKTAPRWAGITRPYTAEQVLKLRGSFRIQYTLAQMGAERLWQLLHTEPFVRALGAITGNQAVQMVQAGLKSIYMSGWQVAGDNNTAAGDLPRPEPLSRGQRAQPDPPPQQGPAARRRNRPHGWQTGYLLDGPHRR